jgi:hypothetical protein
MADHHPPPHDKEHRDEVARYYASLSADERRRRIVLEPTFRDAYNEITQAHQVVQLPRYFWDKWVPTLGPTTTTVYVNLRKHCYYNSRTGEMRDNWETRQETLAWECGIKDRKTLRKCLVLLETLGFIKRTPSHAIDPRTGRPYRTTDNYQVFFEVPLIDQDAVELLLRRVGLAAQNQGARVVRKNSPLRPRSGSGPVGNPVEEGKISSSAEETFPSKRDYLEILNERNVAGAPTKSRIETGGMVALGDVLTRTLETTTPPRPKTLASVLPKIQTTEKNKERLVRVEDLAGQILEVLGDGRSRAFYRMVARRFLDVGREHEIYQLLSEIKTGAREGQLNNPAAVFTARVKELAQLSDIDL